ncbi:IS110 family transposase [Nocardiopsis sp. CNS-639]|uniref:IS110 family transposase n=1 Tax=Nocardiopsis sp. CNS-639 TaxID=1169153 RepID=UPI00047664BB|nr:IS110 family transposase [Nocardiopsis sp. CNS-639]
MSTHQRIWVGIDAGKGHHWAVAIDAEGSRLLSRKVVNDEAEILDLIADVCGLADEVRWAVDISSRPSALLLALLLGHDQEVVYIPGRTVNRMSGAFAGDHKTDAKDAQTIAETARMRSDFRALELAPDLVGELALLTSYRANMTGDRVKMINRLRELLVGICPALERSFEFRKRPGLVLVSGYCTPSALRRMGVGRLTAWLAKRDIRNASYFAHKAVEAAKSQTTSLPGEKRAAALASDLARQILDLDERIKRIDREIADVLGQDERGAIIQSMPGMGPLLTAEFIALAGDLSAYRDAGHLASHAGIAPVARDSGKRTNNNRRPRHYSRRLCRLFYLSAQSALLRPGASQEYYRRKRAEGMIHPQAVLCLARQRINVLWAMLRDGRPYAHPVPGAA